MQRLAAFLDGADAAAAFRAIGIIRDAALSLRAFPERGAPLKRPGVRRLTVPFGRAAYLLDYRLDQDAGSITILRIRHSREAR